MGTLRLVMGVIHNPSNEWMSCVLKSNSQKVRVSPIPPRSTRPIPAALHNPEIVSESTIARQNTTKFEASRAVVSSSIVIESLEVKIQGTWKGSITMGDLSEEVRLTLAVREKDLNGYFMFNNEIHFMYGNLNPISKKIVFSHFSLSQSRTNSKSEEINGTLQLQNEKYTIVAQGSDFKMKIVTDVVQDIEIDNTLSGFYIGNYSRGQILCEVLATITATTNGLVTGRGTEGNRDFTLFGMVDRESKKFNFVRIKAGEVMFYYGDASIEDDMAFHGHWQIESQRGDFNMIRVESTD